MNEVERAPEAGVTEQGVSWRREGRTIRLGFLPPLSGRYLMSLSGEPNVWGPTDQYAMALEPTTPRTGSPMTKNE